MRHLQVLMLLLSVFALGSESAVGQLFGPRTFGRGVAPRAGPGGGGQAADGSGTIGVITGRERFIRANRPRGFVGIPESPVFVGQRLGTAEGDVRLATEDLRRRRPRSANIEALRSNVANIGSVYGARLVIDLDEGRQSDADLAREINETLADPQITSQIGLIRVRMDGRTATLVGEVPSEDARLLAEAVVQLEPGVERIVNQLVVAPPPIP